MKRRSVFVVAFMAALALVLVACGDDGGGTTPAAANCTTGKLKGIARISGQIAPADLSGSKAVAQAKPVVRIGMFGDLTGANSALVTPIRDSATLAVEQANAKGNLKVTIELVVRDNKDANPDTAPPIEQGFIQDDRVVGVIGGAFSGETLAVGQLFDRAGLTHITASATNPDITKKGWPIFRAVVPDSVQGAKMAGLLKAIGCTKIAVVDDKTDYGKGLADIVNTELGKVGITPVSRESVAQKTTDYGPLIDTLSAKAPDAVFYGGYYNDGSLILKQMRERGLKALFACGDGCVDRQLVQLAGAANANGALLTCPCVIPALATTPEAVKLQTDYKAKFGKDALIYSAEAWDAASIFINAIDASDEDGTVTREEILKFVQDLADYKGVSRSYTFEENGELGASSLIINVYPVVGGDVKLLGSTEDSTP